MVPLVPAVLRRLKVQRLLCRAQAAVDDWLCDAGETAATEHEDAVNGWKARDRAVAIEELLGGLRRRRELLAIDIIAMEIRYAQYDALVEAARRVNDADARQLLLHLATEIILPKTT